MISNSDPSFTYHTVEDAFKMFFDYIKKHPALAVSANHAAKRLYGKAWLDKLTQVAPSEYAQFVRQLNRRYGEVCSLPSYQVLGEYLDAHDRILREGTLAVMRLQSSVPVPATLRPSPYHCDVDKCAPLFTSRLIKDTGTAYAQSNWAMLTPAGLLARLLGLTPGSTERHGSFCILLLMIYLPPVLYLMMVMFTVFNESGHWESSDAILAFLGMSLCCVVPLLDGQAASPDFARVHQRYLQKRWANLTWNSAIAEWSDITTFHLGIVSMHHLQSDVGLTTNWLGLSLPEVAGFSYFLQDPEDHQAYFEYHSKFAVPQLRSK